MFSPRGLLCFAWFILTLSILIFNVLPIKTAIFDATSKSAKKRQKQSQKQKQQKIDLMCANIPSCGSVSAIARENIMRL